MSSAINLSVVSEFDPGRFSTEASSLRWPPGFFPEQVDTNLGNQLPLQRVRLDQYAAVYRQQFGCVEVVVYND